MSRRARLAAVAVAAFGVVAIALGWRWTTVSTHDELAIAGSREAVAPLLPAEAAIEATILEIRSLPPAPAAADIAVTPSGATPPAATPPAAAPSAATPSAATPSAATPSAATPSAATPPAATPRAATPRAAPPSAAPPSQGPVRTKRPLRTGVSLRPAPPSPSPSRAEPAKPEVAPTRPEPAPAEPAKPETQRTPLEINPYLYK